MSAIPPVLITSSSTASPSAVFSSARTAIFLLSSFLALTFSNSPSSRPLPTSDGSSEDAVAQPEDVDEARRMVVEEQEEELLDEAGFGLTVPSGAPRPALIIVMALSIPFIDGDSLHPKSNVAKMSVGTPLTDADRLPWLALIRSTAERVCREEWVRAERNYAGIDASGGMEDLAGDESIAEMAEYEFGEGWKWRNAGKDDEHHVRASLKRPAVIIACSALKKWYREILRGNVEAQPPQESDLPTPAPELSGVDNTHKAATARLDTYFVYCKGSKELLTDRISKRKGHFMGAQMLESQLATLEDPSDEPDCCIVDISKSPDECAEMAYENVLKLVKAA
ncbi:hypothetical protein QFC21_002168 [Naganishia friedmannii]|uniref:Uncharacterized protein n=1 Tax=Naganishia friedmannii TaxID=89922 RepID=A0ACC2W0L6_9TREE|nr:hypothetical protein QFC21_002168 [Naganishia friedmannii]